MNQSYVELLNETKADVKLIDSSLLNLLASRFIYF